MKHRYDLIVFDWDGTLMDSTGRIIAAIDAAGRDMDLPTLTVAERLNVIGLGLHEAVDALYPGLNAEQTSHYLERYRHHFVVACSEPEQMFDGAVELLQALSADGRCSLAVATGKSRKGLERAFAQTGCGDYFHASRTADETTSKPDPHMLIELMALLGVEPERTVMIGDTEYDLEMAGRAGTDAVAVTYGAHEAERLTAYPVCSTHDNMYSLSRWILSEMDIAS